MIRNLLTTALGLTLMSSKVRDNPYAVYRATQSLERVHKSPFGFWFISGHEEVNSILTNKIYGSDQKKADLSLLQIGRLNRLVRRRQPFDHRGPFLEMFDKLLVFIDPPDHTRLRKLIARAASNSRAMSLEPVTKDIINELLDGVASDGQMELVNDYALPLPTLLMCELLGVPKKDAPFIIKYAPALAAGFNPSSMRTEEMIRAADTATTELRAYITDLIAQRRHDTSQDDLLTQLIAAEADGEKLSQEELIVTFLGVLFAGIQTTSMAISSGVVTLLENPHQLSLLMRQPELAPLAVDELVRLQSPFQILERTTLEEVELGGKTIPKGSIVILSLAAANRDRRAFKDPNKVDITRDPNPHVAFGGGSHFCIGSHVARMETAAALLGLFERFPTLRLQGPKPVWRNSFTIRGLQSLDVTWR